MSDLLSVFSLGQKQKKNTPRLSTTTEPIIPQSQAPASAETTVISTEPPLKKQAVPLNDLGFEMAKEYPFTLDDFQVKAIKAIHNGESVLVSAHTSAGKTVTAEYAIAQCFKQNARVIYTSPIKALSNQKFAEFQEEFGDVGLLTGDVSINPNSQCLVMTTEILRSMLYRGSALLNEVKWVIFDEIHYMRDPERGVVWEESIILLPDTVRFVFLSATVPNAKEFADWIADLKSQPCHVVYTDFRPTPLQHFIYPENSKKLFLVVDKTQKFREDSFEKSMASLHHLSAKDERQKRFGVKGSGTFVSLGELIEQIMKQRWHPAIVFSFSKKECELCLKSVSRTNITFNDDDEVALVDMIFKRAIDLLTPDDQEMEAVQAIIPFLRNGLGVHHGGMLPILKEITEILFQEGLIKVLFATETFAMGLNMPAHTVVFNSLKKFDGLRFRMLNSGEYIQMAGRAGRRGHDESGIVILNLNSKSEPEKMKEMLTGQPFILTSSFKLHNYQILNFLRIQEDQAKAHLNDLILRSFMTYQSTNNLESLKEKRDTLNQLLKAYDAFLRANRQKHKQLTRFFIACEGLLKVERKLRNFRRKPQFLVPLLQKGRVMRVEPEHSAPFLIPPATTIAPLKQFFFLQDEEEVLPLRNSEREDILLDYVFPTDAPEDFYSSMTQDDLTSVASLMELDTNKKSAASQIAVVTNVRQVKSSRNSHELIGKYSVEVLCQERTFHAGGSDSYIVRRIGEDELSSIVTPLTSLTVATSAMSQQLRAVDDSDSQTQFQRIFGKLSQRRFDVVEDVINEKSPHFAEYATLMNRATAFQRMLTSTKLDLQAEEDQRLFAVFRRYEFLKRHAKMLDSQIKSNTSASLQEELTQRLRILKKMSYIDSNECITLKGRIAADISTADSLVLTELLFSGFFSGFTALQLTGLLSTFVFDSRMRNEVDPPEDLKEGMEQMNATLKHVGETCVQAGLELDLEEYLKSLQPHMMVPVMTYASGSTFAEAMESQEGLSFEGDLVRVLRRLEELLRQMALVADYLNTPKIQEAFADARVMIKRGIPFAASLYIND
ncbi:hypothetical protein PCE1_004880 [Barthelona sp. PCE]